MYNYIVKLEIANDKKREEFDLRTIKSEIQKAIDKYHALKTVRNKKSLTFSVEQKVLEIKIESPVQLDVPSKALAKFTRLLLELSPALAGTINNGRVFQSVQTSIPPSDIDRISSCDTLKKIIDLFCGELQTNANLELQRKIKALLFNVEEVVD